MKNYKLFKIAYPCSVHWSEMKGDSKKRFCDLCKKDVHNMCRMSKDEVNELLADTARKGEDRFCIYIEPPLFKKILNFTAACFVTVCVGALFKKSIITKLFGQSGCGAGGCPMIVDESKFNDFIEPHDPIPKVESR